MSANSFGKHWKITTFGESHGNALGVVIEGCPSGVDFDEKCLKSWLERRRPGNASEINSSRNEPDDPQILSGIYQKKTLGTPIAVAVYNTDQRSSDYKEIIQEPRLGHADDVWKEKFSYVDLRGGGRSSGRETIARVIGGAFAEMFLKQISSKLEVVAFADQISNFRLSPEEFEEAAANFSRKKIGEFFAGFPSLIHHQQVKELLIKAKKEGKSYGGKINLIIRNPVKGIGQPVFNKLKSDLAAAFMSIGATCSLEIGLGSLAVNSEGSIFHNKSLKYQYGGIRGGISTGENILCKIGFKPPASVLKIAKNGRHDPCIVPRAIPVIESMALLVLADHYLWKKLDNLS